MKLKSDEGRTASFWEATEGLIDGSRGGLPASADVCIVGGGIAGLTAAYLLSEAMDVVVIDDGLIGGGETCRTTAHLTNAIDDRIYRIEEWHGEEKAHLAVESHTAAIDKIEEIIDLEGIDCDFERLDGYLFEAEDGGTDDLEREFEAARRCGIGVEWAERAPFEAGDTGRCIRFPAQAQFHVLKYLRGVAAATEKRGGKLISHTRVTDWTGGASPTVTIDGKLELAAGKIVLATNYPLMSKMFAQLPAYRTYAIGIAMPKRPAGRALLWDTGDPYIYVRTQPDGDGELLIVGGEDHRTGQADDHDERFTRLEEWSRSRFPSAAEVKYRWSGQFLETHDGLAFIGKFSDDEPNVFLITGDSGMGMTHGTLGAMLVSELIEGRDHPWAEVYDPSRMATQSIKQAVPEVISSTVPYKDWITPGEVDSADDIRPGDGAILRDGLSKLAVYRDEQGHLHRRSAVCTHMGCIVRFNSLEKTWDCPCHGSRFGVDGDPINTPAISPLAAVEEEA